MLRKIALFCFLCVITIQITYSQGYVGREFFLSNMEYFYKCFDTANPQQGVYITSPYAAKVKFIKPGALKGHPDSATLVPNKTQYFKFGEYDYPLHYFHSDIISDFSAHILSDSDISVVYAIQTDSVIIERSKGAAAIMPVNSIPYGSEYIITTNIESKVFTCIGGQFRNVAPQMIITGIAPLSRIEVVPKAGSAQNNDQPFKPFYIELKQGETFYYVSRRWDLTGSIIRAKDSLSRFAVFAGDKLTGSALPDSSGVVCKSGDDYGMEQMIPTVSWGKSYTALPFKEMHAGYYLKIVASQRNTRVFVNGVFSRILNEGEHFTYNVTTQLVTKVVADRPISVTQFIKGGLCSGHTLPKFKLGDHEQLNLTADTFDTKLGWISTISQFDLWYGDTLVKPENYVNIICKTSDTATILLNGKKIRNSEWKASNIIPGKSYAQVFLDSGAHFLSSVNSFNYYVYGYGNLHGHAYQGHSNTRPMHNNFVYDMGCKLDSIKFQVLNTTDFYNFSWNFGDGSPTAAGRLVRHPYKDTGWFNTVLHFQHKVGNIYDSVTKRIYISHAGPGDILIDNNNVFVKDTIVCGKLDLNVYAKDLNYANQYLWNDNITNYLRNFKVPGEFSIIVKERNTCVSMDTIRLVNYPFPTAVFTSTDTGFCESNNRPVTYYNKSFSPDSIVRNVWDFGILEFENNDSVVSNTFNRPGQYLVKLRVYAETGCWHDTFQQFTMYPSPHAEFDVVNVDSCFNTNQVTFINRTVVDTTLYQWYKWYFSEGYIISRNNPVGPRTYSAPGSYFARLMYEYNNGCFDTAIKTITIYDNPKADFQVLKNVNCLLDSVKFINLSASPYQPLSYQWYFGDMQESQDSHPAHLYTGKGNYNVKLTTMSPQSCRDSVIKPVYVSGDVAANFRVNDSVQCFDSHRFKLYNTSVSDTGNITVADWLYANGSSTELDSLTVIFSSAGLYPIKLKVENIFGCKDSIVKQVRLHNNPKGNISVNKNSQCENDQDFDFLFTPQFPADSIIAYKWYYPNDSSGGAPFLNDIQFPFRGKHDVEVKTRSTAGCDNLSKLKVSVNAAPVAGFLVPDKIQCFSGHAFVFNNTSTIAEGQIKNYRWDFGDNSSSVLQNPPSKKYLNPGQYLIELSAESDSGCIATDTMSVFINRKANALIAPIAAVCLNDSTAFSAVISGSDPESILWDFGDNNSSVNMPAKHRYAEAGTYKVKLVVNSGQSCIDTITAPTNAVVRDLPIVDFNTYFRDGTNDNTFVKFTNTSKMTKDIEWDFESLGKAYSNDTTLNIFDSLTLKVTLRISDQHDCYNSKTEYIFISGPLKIFIPNVFSPNNDGHNDKFAPAGVQYASEYRLTIFNRWGEIMYRSDDPFEQWDGTFMNNPCPVGVYIYTLELRDLYGRYHSFEGSFLLQW